MLKLAKKIVQEHKVTFLKFCIIGGLATVVNYLVFLLLLQIFQVNYLISSASGYISGVFLGFFFNKRFTFKSESKKYTLEIVKYLVVYTASLFMGLLVLRLFVFMGINVLIANVLVIGFTTMTNYTGTKYFVFHENFLIRKFNYWIYRFRYLVTYIIIGLGSIFVEVVYIIIANNVYYTKYFNTLTGFGIGVIFSFILNSRLNFKVPKERNFRNFNFFVVISVFAFILNLVLIRTVFVSIGFTNYSISRFVSAAIVFLISYTLHRRITFIDVKEVGIPVYLSSEEDVEEISEKVKYYPDFIHFDLVDKTFNPKAKKVEISKGAEAKKHWPLLSYMTHIMSKHPLKWIDRVSNFSDFIIVHAEIEDEMEKVFDRIKKLNRKPGIAINYNTPLEKIINYLDKVAIIQVLGIKKPGESAQHMESGAIHKLNELNALKKSYNFQLCFDGGIRLTNIHKINAKYIVSGSTVLKSQEIMESIYAIKTSSKYYYEHDKDLKSFLQRKILNTLNKIEFVVSGTIVGSFVEKDIRDVGDVDIIVILDTLTKKKYEKVIGNFETIKKIIKADFDRDTVINSTLGPLKFNEKNNVVLHIMIYDVKQHIEHCRKSPFTCLDWQRSQVYVKKPLKEIYEVYCLEPSNFFSARRSIRDYMKDISSKKISYRKYNFKDGINQEVKYKDMENKDFFEFSYHIMKFVMSNFQKLCHKDNKIRNIESYQTKQDRRFFQKLTDYKSKNRYPKWNGKFEKSLMRFLENFESGFKKQFNKKIYLMRHAQTRMNKNKEFIGQKSNPSILDSGLEKSQFESLNVNKIISSPLKRCIQTAEIAEEILNVPLVVEENLKEIDYGLLDGSKYSELESKYPQIIKAWRAGKDAKFPEGENYEMLLKRVWPIINKVKEGSLICTHNVVIRVLIGKLYNIPREKWFLLNIPHENPIEVIRTKQDLYINLTDKQREEIFVNFG